MAADPNLMEYIRRQINAGFRKQQIYDALLQAGWYKEEVDAAFYEISLSVFPPSYVPAAPKAASAKQELPASPGFFWKLGNSIVRPGALFESVRKEPDIGNSLKFYGAVSFIHLTIALVGIFFAVGFLTNFLETSFLNYLAIMLPELAKAGIISLFFGYFILLAFTFIASGIAHAFVWILRGSRGFVQTYKSLAYSFSVTLLFWPAFLLCFLLPGLTQMIIQSSAIFILAWMACLIGMGLCRLHQVPVFKAAISVSAPIAISAIALIYMAPWLGLLSPQESGGAVTGFDEFYIQRWNYDYQGNFSIMLKNNDTSPMTINTVTAECGEERNSIPLSTMDPTHLEPGGSAYFSTGLEKCSPKEAGDAYTISVGVRYLNEDKMMVYSSSGSVSGIIM